MNTAYRVWDGEQMHHWDDEGLSLEIKGNEWVLWRNDRYGFQNCITGSHEEGSVLMWGTGLKDKNEKMIYEYDIDMIDNEPMIVVYIDGRFGLKFPENNTYFDDCIAWDECDIRGDVYQNPELLEGAE
ncbi:YopX family protein [Bacillus halotolerans]|uniref:YopX family protein n=1 Tax=Bacillus halotolerans TaxID=260554 RepID=UPI00298EF2CB|nr:YopX family protein [Bacillus halotolerans]WPC79749.1 YopX family protein [Bacillus halotolerans]